MHADPVSKMSPTKQLPRTTASGQTEVLENDDRQQSSDLLAGIQLADYQLTDRLGAGGYGEVWRAIGPGGLPKAVKVLYGERNGVHAEAELKALERMRELRHPFLLSIERIEVVNSRLIVVTELADGNLSDRFRACTSEQLRGIPRDELLAYLKDAADALDYMSDKHGLQHLDIKPDNILIQGEHAKVGDFGLAKDLNVTNVSVMNGFTPTFAAPELFDGRPGHASDQYSLAIVYQYMLTGSLPFNGRTAAQLTVQHLKSQPDLSDLQPVDRPVIARALSKNMRSRFDSCRHLIDELAKRNHSRTPGRASVRQTASTGPAAAASDTNECDTRDLSKHASEPVAFTPCEAGSQPLRKCIFVGLGGLGGAVLNQLRQLYRSVPGNTSDCSVLHIDSMRSDLPAGDGESVLTPKERICIPLRSSKEYRSARNMDLSWLSRRWLFNIPRSQQVEGIRPLGRLALCDHLDTVRDALEQFLLDANSPAADDSQNAQSNERRGLDVFVVSGTSGGTGSGTVADIGLLLREIASKQSLADVRVCGILMHSTGASGTADVQEANTVSVLNELAHMNTPGLGTPRGFNTEPSDTTPFDDAWMIHLGDGLHAEQFRRETENVAAYLFSAARTTAQADYRDWSRRDSASDTGSRQMKILGISTQKMSDLHDTTEESAHLTSMLLRRWTGRPDGEHSSEAEISFDVGATQTFLSELKLSEQSLTPQIRTLLQGNLGTEIHSCSDNLFQSLRESHALNELNYRQVVEAAETTLQNGTGSSSARSIDQIVSELQSTLSGITGKCCTALRQHLVPLVDSAHRIPGAAAAAECAAASLTQSIASCRRLQTDLESARAGLREPPEPSDPESPVSEETARSLCRELCCLTAAQLVYECFTEHLKTVLEDVEQFRENLHQAAVKVTSAAKDAECHGKPQDPLPAPVIDAFDGHVRSEQPVILRNLLHEDSAADDLKNRVMQLAAQFIANARRSSHHEEQTARGSFPKDVWPRFRGCGGKRRVLCVAPENINTAELEQTLRQEFDDCTGSRTESIPCVLTVCETTGVAIESLTSVLTRTNPKIADVAGRIHTRIDVDW